VDLARSGHSDLKTEATMATKKATGSTPSTGGENTAADAQFTKIIDALVKDPRVTDPRAAQTKGFGSNGLKVGGKLFAMTSKGRFVVKLPKDRVNQLVSSGKGEYFDPGHGRLMKEWLALSVASKATWLSLAKEALAFVAGD
jgi:hypothetical protein